jgi:hypothetical protein
LWCAKPGQREPQTGIAGNVSGHTRRFLSIIGRRSRNAAQPGGILEAISKRMVHLHECQGTQKHSSKRRKGKARRVGSAALRHSGNTAQPGGRILEAIGNRIVHLCECEGTQKHSTKRREGKARRAGSAAKKPRSSAFSCS